MLETTNGSDRDPNGIALPCITYVKGKEYDVGPELAKVFCEEINVAEPSDGQVEPSGSPKEGAPENKSEDVAPETKRGGKRSRR
jgi:hypothetical protein